MNAAAIDRSITLRISAKTGTRAASSAYFAVKLLVNSSLALLPLARETVRLPSLADDLVFDDQLHVSPTSSMPRLSAATRTQL